MPSQHILRRNGRPQACEPCRASKNRCDHATPVCNRCSSRGRSHTCVYHPAPMTKVRKPSVGSPAKLLRLLPETQAPQAIQNMLPMKPLPPSTYGSSRPTLFKRTGPTYDKTSFSAVFRENRAKIGAHLLDVEDDNLNSRTHVYDDPARMKLAVQTLKGFPTYEICERLLASSSTIIDPWISPKMVSHCLKSVWSTFGESLRDSKSDDGLSYMARVLFKNGERSACPDEAEPWVNWFSGSSLRWEMIGVLFTLFGLSMMQLQDWDLVFGLPEKDNTSRKSAALLMKECADACLGLRNTDFPTSDLVLCLLKTSWKLLSQIVGDECDEINLGMASVITLYIDTGLHRLPEHEAVTPHSQFRRTLAASGYQLEKSHSLFKGRPPGLTRFYCSFQPPLDLADDELYGSSEEEFAAAVSQLDRDGWNTTGRIHTATFLRALCLIVPIREEILEISLGINTEIPQGRVDQLLKDLSVITTSSYPAWIQYQNISQWAQPSCCTTNNKYFYIVTRIHAEVLQTKFLLERLKQTSASRNSSQSLYNTAQELMSVTLSLWLDRDRLCAYQSAFHWMAVDYGIPAAGVLCVELLSSIRHPYGADTIKISRSDTTKSLVMFVSLLGWVRPGDGNYALCQKLKNAIQKVLDHALDALVPAAPNPLSLEENGVDVAATPVAIDCENTRAYNNPLLEVSEAPLSEEDWMSLLNTLDWTQGFGLEN